MNRFKKFLNITTVVFMILGIGILSLAYYNAEKDIKARQREQAVLDYYESVETLLDSLYIECSDSIFKTNAGSKYLESKYTFESLFIYSKNN